MNLQSRLQLERIAGLQIQIAGGTRAQEHRIAVGCVLRGFLGLHAEDTRKSRLHLPRTKRIGAENRQRAATTHELRLDLHDGTRNLHAFETCDAWVEILIEPRPRAFDGKVRLAEQAARRQRDLIGCDAIDQIDRQAERHSERNRRNCKRRASQRVSHGTEHRGIEYGERRSHARPASNCRPPRVMR